MKRYLFALMFVILSVVECLSQNFSVTSNIDSTILAIGEQACVTYSVFQPIGKQVMIPFLGDTIVKNLEIVERRIDTIFNTPECLQLDYKFVITAFDSALYFIPPMPFALEGDTCFSDALSVKVVSVEIDTVQNAITDIKPIEKAPFNWREWALYALIVLLIVGAIIVSVKLYQRFKNRENAIEKVPAKEERSAPDVEALAALHDLKAENLLAKEQIKEYQTKLVDILRVYIERTFDVNTMEKTSEEILTALSLFRHADGASFSALKEILQTADFVKFAKLNPPEETHVKSMVMAEEFVVATTKAKKQEEEQKIVSQ